MKKISIKIDGHSTSITISDDEVLKLNEISKKINVSRNMIVSKIEAENIDSKQTLSAAVRKFISENDS